MGGARACLQDPLSLRTTNLAEHRRPTNETRRETAPVYIMHCNALCNGNMHTNFLFLTRTISASFDPACSFESPTELRTAVELNQHGRN